MRPFAIFMLAVGAGCAMATSEALGQGALFAGDINRSPEAAACRLPNGNALMQRIEDRC